MIYIILGLIVLAMLGMISSFREIKILKQEIDQLKSLREVRADEHAAVQVTNLADQAAIRAEDRANEVADQTAIRAEDRANEVADQTAIRAENRANEVADQAAIRAEDRANDLADKAEVRANKIADDLTAAKKIL